MCNCYNKMGKKAEALRCNERAERFKDKEGIALHKLAKLYVSIGDTDKAATCFKLNLQRKEGQETSEKSEAYKFLAAYAKSKGNFEEAAHYARGWHEHSDGSDREAAGALLREINALSQQRVRTQQKQ